MQQLNPLSDWVSGTAVIKGLREVNKGSYAVTLYIEKLLKTFVC